jgi:hypothetical protein
LHNRCVPLHDASPRDARCDDTLSDDGSGNGHDDVCAMRVCVGDMYDSPSTSDYDNSLDRIPNTKPNDTLHRSESKTNQKSLVSPHILARLRSCRRIYLYFPLSSHSLLSRSRLPLSELPRLDTNLRLSRLVSLSGAYLFR